MTPALALVAAIVDGATTGAADSICAKCRRAADPDTELTVIVLGLPMCAACAAELADELDAEDGDTATNSAPWEVEVEQAVADFERTRDAGAFKDDLYRLGFDGHEVARWVSEHEVAS